MDVNNSLRLSPAEFDQIMAIASAMGVTYDGVYGGEANPHHKFSYPGHRAPWLFVIDAAWRTARHVRFQHSYRLALQDLDMVQEEHSGRNVSIPFDALGAAIESCCNTGPSEAERRLQGRIIEAWSNLLGAEYAFRCEWPSTPSGIPDIIAEVNGSHQLVVMELKVVHTGPEALTQLKRYLSDSEIRRMAGQQSPLGGRIAPSFQRSILAAKPPVRLYAVSDEPLGLRLIHDGWDAAPER